MKNQARTASDWHTRTMFGPITFAIKIFLWVGLLIQYKIAAFLGLRYRNGYSRTFDTFKASTSLRWFSLSELNKFYFSTRATTRPLYLESCRAHGYKSRIEALASNASALYYDADPAVADKSSSAGGGFYLGTVPGHWDFFDSLIAEAEKQGKVLSVVVLEYSLTPSDQCPFQITQTINFFRHLLREIPPSKILLGGESAGGNLSLSLLAHILHQSPYGPPIVLESPLAGMLLISPWVTFDTGADSMTKFADYDILFPEILRTWAEEYNPGLKIRNGWTEALGAEEGWWKGCGALLDGRILVTGGAHELMKDDIVAFKERLVKEGVGVEFFLPDGIHAEPIHGITGLGPEGSAAWLAHLRWLGEVVSK
ncbi:alpha/beta-hydrolase [Tuber magnatum]|uniref:Alpha/beta-hydrolase n=1 Tax=Tuber magnatum TaxID=42249 RepID=A0A317SDD1_9PEZI|nr:alpha/beta-hydrolase [Tuber magnatum]